MEKFEGHFELVNRKLYPNGLSASANCFPHDSFEVPTFCAIQLDERKGENGG